MTRTRSSPAAVTLSARASDPGALRLRWQISFHAAVAAGLVPAHEPRCPVHLDLTLTPADPPRQALVTAHVVTPRRTTPLALERHPQPAILRDAQEMTLHVDIPGLLHASFSDHPDRPPTPLYARTDLLARLGIPGGRYELIDAPAPDAS